MSLHGDELRPPMNERELQPTNKGRSLCTPHFSHTLSADPEPLVTAPGQRSWSEYLRRWGTAIPQGSSECFRRRKLLELHRSNGTRPFFATDQMPSIWPKTAIPSGLKPPVLVSRAK
jgi:hypothetical protein